jgi:esterase/lipase
MHALNDDLIPCTQALQLYHWANQPKELLMFERGNHNNILAVNADTYFEAVGRMTENCRPVTRGTS